MIFMKPFVVHWLHFFLIDLNIIWIYHYWHINLHLGAMENPLNTGTMSTIPWRNTGRERKYASLGCLEASLHGDHFCWDFTLAILFGLDAKDPGLGSGPIQRLVCYTRGARRKGSWQDGGRSCTLWVTPSQDPLFLQSPTKLFPSQKAWGKKWRAWISGLMEEGRI